MANENLLFVQPNQKGTHTTLSELRAKETSHSLAILTALAQNISQGTSGKRANEILAMNPQQSAMYFANLVGQPAGAVRYARPNEPFVFSFQNDGELYPGPARFYGEEGMSRTGELIEADRFVLPVPPSDISVSIPNSPQTINTISGLVYSHAGDIDLEEVSFEGFFPHITGPVNEWPSFIPPYVKLYGYRTPTRCVTEFTTAMRANQPFWFSIFANDANAITSSAGPTVIEPILMSISSFEWSLGNATGGTRQDITYSMTLKKWRRQTISVVNRVRK